MTFFLAEVHCGLMAINGGTRTRNLAPMAEGFMLCSLVCMFAYISGAHFNPAVTFAAVLVQGIRVEEAVMYWLMQVVCGFAGAMFGFLVSGIDRNLPAPQVHRNTAEYLFSACVSEAVFTMILVSVVLHVAYSPQKNHSYHGLAVGMVLLAIEYAVGGVAGGAFNPALATGLLITKFITGGYFTPLLHLWIYWGAPIVGAFAAAVLFKMTYPPPTEAVEEEQRNVRLAKDLYSTN